MAGMRVLRRIAAVAIAWFAIVTALSIAPVSASADGSLVAIDARSGDVVWRAEPPTGQRYSASFSTSGGIFAQQLDGEWCNPSRLVRIDAEDGDVDWAAQSGIGGAGAGVVLAIDNYGPGQPPSIRALAATSGAERWQRQLNAGDSVSTGTTMIFVNRVSGSRPGTFGDIVLSRLEAMHRRNGEPAWTLEPESGIDPPYGSMGLIHSDARYTLLYDERIVGPSEDPMPPLLRVLDTETGKARFSFELGNQRGPVLVIGRRIITQDGETLAVRDAETGEVRWQRALSDSALLVDASVRNGSVYVVDRQGTGEGPIVSLDLRDGEKRWATRVRAASATVTNFGDLISFSEGAVAGIDPESGRTRWTRDYPTGVAPTWGSPVAVSGGRRLYLTSQCDY